MEREQITIRLPAELKEKIQQAADRKGISFNSMVIIFLEAGLKVQ
ncbi:MAG: Arc family DNA-binding protein [Clostridiales bacterium]|nr:Arc family DNA-binding protein [Clostridiales bacterium]